MSSESRSAGTPPVGGHDRRSFLKASGGVATGVAVTVLPSAAVALASPAIAGAHGGQLGKPVEAHGDVPPETVMAYVHDAERAEVTVVAGTSQMTYRDPVLAKRLLDAARAQTA
jgi:hypothetical protein